MYKDFYGMKREIFTTLPQPEVFFDSEIHKGAWYYLLQGIKSQEPYMLVTGDYGTGKTLLSLKLCKTLEEENISFAHISSANYSYTNILREIVDRLGLEAQQEDDSSLQSVLYRYFHKEELKPIYVIVDDVHEFDDPSRLNKLWTLANFSHDGVFPIHLVLFAHTSFLDRLKLFPLIPLDQRIRRRYQLIPFNFTETKEFIYFQLFNSGASGSPYFSEEAVQKIFVYSGGIPRRINIICDAALLIGATQGLKVIEGAVIEEAAKSLNLPNRKGDKQDTLPLDEEKAEYAENGETEREEEGFQTEKGVFLNKKILYLLILLAASLLVSLVALFWKGGIFSAISGVLQHAIIR